MRTLHFRFPKMGASFGLLGVLFCFLLFGGTSKYCSTCRAIIKQHEDMGDDYPHQLDKRPRFRLIWVLVAVGILGLLAVAA